MLLLMTAPDPRLIIIANTTANNTNSSCVICFRDRCINATTNCSAIIAANNATWNGTVWISGELRAVNQTLLGFGSLNLNNTNRTAMRVSVTTIVTNDTAVVPVCVPNPCTDGKVCVPDPKVCVTEPCFQYACVVVDQINPCNPNPCALGTVCTLLNQTVITNSSFRCDPVRKLT